MDSPSTFRRRSLIAVTALLALFSVAAAVLAQSALASDPALRFSPPRTISSPGFEAGPPQVAVDPAGNRTIAWSDSRIRVARVASDGTIAPLLTFEAPGELAGDPVVVVANDGVATIAWTNEGSPIDPADSAMLQAVRISSDGTPDKVLTLDRTIAGPGPKLTLDNDEGRTTIVYTPDGGRLRAVQIESDGQVGIPREIRGPGDGQLAATVADGAGRVLVGLIGEGRVEAILLDRAGNPGPVETLFRGPSKPLNPTGYPDIALTRRDVIVNRVRFRGSQVAGSRVLVRRLSRLGVPQKATTLAHARKGRFGGLVAEDGLVAWSRQSPGRRQIQAVRLGSPGDSATSLSGRRGRARAPEIGVDGRGRATVVWFRKDQERVEASQLTRRGVTHDRQILSRGGPTSFLDVAVDSLDRPSAVWVRYRATGEVQLVRGEYRTG